MQPITYSVSKGLRAGAIAGFVGSIVLGIFGEIGAVAMNQELYYTTVARRMGFGDSSVLGGWTLHFIVGIVAGSIFIGATAAIRRFSLTTTKKAIWVGILGGHLYSICSTGLLLQSYPCYCSGTRSKLKSLPNSLVGLCCRTQGIRFRTGLSCRSLIVE